MDITYAYSLMVKPVLEKLTQWYELSLYLIIHEAPHLNFPLSNANKGFSSQTGPNSATKENWGVNYRALNDLFDISQRRRSSIIYEMGVQMVEIYNEQVRDLLSNDGSQKKYPF